MWDCITLLWLIEAVNYLLPLLLSEWTVFSIAGNIYSKDLDKQYTLGNKIDKMYKIKILKQKLFRISPSSVLIYRIYHGKFIQSTLLILFFFFVLHCSSFNVSFVNALHFFYLVLCIRPRSLEQFFIAIQFLLKIFADC